MPSQIDTNDPFLILLTDALRAGPGSPEWHQAVAQLKLSGENVDEYKLLIDAREALESGREYRSVRAGPGFTRKLLTELDQRKPPAAPSRFNLATLIAAIAGVVIVAVVAIVVYETYPRTPTDDSARAVNELGSTYFSKEIGAATFENGIPATWRTIGSLPLDTAGGLKAANAPVPDGDYAGGGIVLAEAIPASQSIALQVSLHINHSGSDLIPQVFVSNDRDFSSDRAISSQELVWQLQDGLQKVVVNGKMARQAKVSSNTIHMIRVLLKGDLAIVEVDGQQWSGRNELGDKPRYLGVRFIRTGSKPGGDAAFTTVRVLAVSS
jgi:hypothetical protein